MAFLQIISLAIALKITNCAASPVGFSYAKFSGPVSGPEKEVFVQDEHSQGHGYVDYVAKPDYQFAYGVEDPKSRVLQNRKESRHGDAVKGEYSVVEPDGSLRVVRYTADKVNGFQAEVITDGKSASYGHETPAPAIAPAPAPAPAPVPAPVHAPVPPPIHRDYYVSPQAPAHHENYGTHEDVRENDDEEDDDDDDDEEDDSY